MWHKGKENGIQNRTFSKIKTSYTTSLIIGNTVQLSIMWIEKWMPVALFAAEYKYSNKWQAESLFKIFLVGC